MHATTIGRLVGVAIHAETVEPVLGWSARSELTAGDLRRTLADVQAIDEMTAPLSDNLKAEYLFSLASVEENSAGWSGLPLKLTGLNRRVRGALNLVYANWLSQADRSRLRRTPARGREWFLFEMDATVPSSAALAPAEIEDRCGLAEQSTQAGLVTQLMPAMKGIFEAVDREQTRQAALVLGLALELFHREQGRFPATLDELVKAAYLKSIPADPFGKGEPFHYRRDADPRQGAVLWSVWTDGIDQDGKVEVDRESNAAAGDKIFRIAAPRAPK
jgi:hypothetical protein